MPRSIWNGVISFGMVSIPVKLYTATENKDIAFHQLHQVCDTRVKYQKFCSHCERTVETDEIEKGYEFAKGQYVVLTEKDFEQIPLPSKHAVEVSAFVKKEQIDPLYYEKAYYLEPEEAAQRPFALFMKAISDKDVVAIATITLRNKERLCALRPVGGTLLLDTLLYPDEIRISENTEIADVKVSEKELSMAEHLIGLMEQDFNPQEYHDHYRQALQKMIQSKLEGKEIAVPAEAPRAKVIDLMEALRISVDNIKQKGTTSLTDKDKATKTAIKAAAAKRQSPSKKSKQQTTPTQEASAQSRSAAKSPGRTADHRKAKGTRQSQNKRRKSA